MQRAIRVIGLCLIIGFLVALLVFNANKPVDYTPWEMAMTKGDKETATHHFIMYTDVFCPYCDKFSNALRAHAEEFKTDYLENKHIFFELRVTDVNYTYGHSNNSRPGGEGAYCAAAQNNFWGYYDALLERIYEEYHSKGIGVSKDSEHIPDLPEEYWTEVAEKGGLDVEAFKACMDSDEMLTKLDKNTERAQRNMPSGVPYFVFDRYTTSGFLGEWDAAGFDWEQAKLLLDAGLASK